MKIRPLVVAAFVAASLTAAPAPAAKDAAETVAHAMLTNIRENGTNPQALGGLGGLWVNWRTGTQPLQVNFNGSGEPDGAKVMPPRHDPLTDLRYLHNLQSWKHQHPADPQFDAELTRFTAVVKKQFGGTKVGRADWVTTEAMGCAMMALFSLKEEQPW